MDSKPSTSDSIELERRDAPIGIESEHLDAPIVRVRFRWEMETIGSPTDCYAVHCPYCDGEEHLHSVYDHLRVALGGVGEARCHRTKEPYYIVLAQQGKGVPYEVIRLARQELVNSAGDELSSSLVPERIDLDAVDDLFY